MNNFLCMIIDKIGYIGQSLGTTGMFELLITRPEFNRIVEPYIALAPIAYTSYMTSILKYFFKLTIFELVFLMLTMMTMVIHLHLSRQ